MSASKCRPAISSMSLGRAYAGHNLLHKFQCAADYGFQGIEIFYEDLETFAKDQSANRSLTQEQSLLEAAKIVKNSCDDLNLTIVGLQPFLFYEGLKDRNEHEKLIEKLHHWFAIVKALGTDIIQIPTQFRQDDDVTGDIDVIVSDLREVADLGLKEDPPVKFAYESLAWGRFIDTWEGAWDVVRKIDRWNFGTCLDTFNILGKIWADPAREGGMVEGDAWKVLDQSMKRMLSEVDVRKIWYIQVVGAERMKTPLVEGHEWYSKDQPSRMSWSRNARLFYGEGGRGQYLPIENVARVLLDPVEKGGLGFSGWVSMELFSRTMNDTREDVPKEHAERGEAAWKKLVYDLKFQ